MRYSRVCVAPAGAGQALPSLLILEFFGSVNWTMVSFRL
jgi:hypothetical protein